MIPGVGQDKPVAVGLSELIQSHAGINSDTYARAARQFEPVHWNADWVAILARLDRMRFIVITSEHHDGFGLFRTTTTGRLAIRFCPTCRWS